MKHFNNNNNNTDDDTYNDKIRGKKKRYQNVECITLQIRKYSN